MDLPLKRTWVIPSINGNYQLLAKAIASIEHAQKGVAGQHKIVFLGDFIDRGPASQNVVELLMRAVAAKRPWIPILGGHEQLAMAADSGKPGSEQEKAWFEAGGLETLKSYRTGPVGFRDHPGWRKHIMFLRGLPYYYADAHRVYVHAGLDEARELRDQRPEVLFWHFYEGRDQGYRGKHVVHAHESNHNAPIRMKNRTAVDRDVTKSKSLIVALFDDELPGPPIWSEFIC